MMRLSAARLLTALGAVAALALSVACGGENEGATSAPKPGTGKPASAKPVPTPPSAQEPETPDAPMDPAQLAERGRTLYMSNCIACHNPNPSQDGALGPAVTGASAELIEARVVDGTYPEGYTPKRDTQVMIALPHLKPEIPAIAAYLNQ
jgi:mono/diheme cytochrome c family protein